MWRTGRFLARLTTHGDSALLPAAAADAAKLSAALPAARVCFRAVLLLLLQVQRHGKRIGAWTSEALGAVWRRLPPPWGCTHPLDDESSQGERRAWVKGAKGHAEGWFHVPHSK